MFSVSVNFDELFNHDWQAPFFVGLASVLFFGSMFLPFIYQRYLSVRYRRAFLLSSIALTIAFVLEFYHYASHVDLWSTIDKNPIFWFHQCLTPGLLTLFFVPFVYMLVSKWLYNQVSDLEKTPGLVGYRSWLCLANLICVVVIAYSYIASFNFWNWNDNYPVFYDPLEFFFSLVALLLVYPTINTIHKKWTGLVEKVKSKHDERVSESAVQSKIIDLLSNGKITPQECAELLAAIYKPKETKGITAEPSDSTPPPAPPDGSSQNYNGEESKKKEDNSTSFPAVPEY